MGIAADESLDGTTGVAVLKQQHILVVADVSAELVIGGAERMLDHHIRALIEAGLEITVLSRQPTPDAPRHIKLHNGVHEHRLPFSGDKGLRGLLQLKREARIWWQSHQGFDAVVAEQPFTMWGLLQAGCRLPRVQICHSFAFEEYATRHGLDWNLKHRLITAAMRQLEGSVYRSANAALVLSQFMQDRLHTFFHIPQEMVTIAAGGIEVLDVSWEKRNALRQSLWGSEAALPHVVTLRNLVPRTGVDLLIQAAAIVHVDRPDVRWTIIGTGELLKPLQGLSATLGMQDVITFQGFLVEKKVSQQLLAADVFMLPTRSLEGFGLVTLEANAHGLPVIATPVGANPDVVGWSPMNHIAENPTPDALAQSLLRYLNQMPDLTQRQELSHATHCHFTWQKHDDALLQAVNSLA